MTCDLSRQAKNDFEEGYTLRSKFVPHGAALEEVDLANRVLVLCLSTIDAVMKMTLRFTTKTALLDHLDDEMLR